MSRNGSSNEQTGGGRASFVAFWTTLPGILTGIAAVLTATVAVVGLSRAVGGTTPGPPPSAAPVSSSPPAPSSGQSAAHLLVGQFDVDLPSGEGIGFKADRIPPQPVHIGAQQADLRYDGQDRSFDTSGTIAVLTGAAPSFLACRTNTRSMTRLSRVDVGTIICFHGHSYVAAITVEAETTTSAKLSVDLWHIS